MNTTTRPIFSHKRIALVAHDSCKQNLLNWVKKHK
ncbi:MAG: methylglyoxal synthase, partial [Haemophilus parainfluenzae]|nr:methylglyoxal synthase [Haemophilus parainfluenzae]